MSWSEVGGAREYVNYANCKKGDEIAEGWYQGTKPGKFNPVHYVKTKEGKLVGLNSSGHLNWILEQVAVGTYVKIIYDGKDVLQTGKFKGKEAHRFQCFQKDGAEAPPSPFPQDVTEPASDEDDPLA